ncbi:hypothetical protein AB205_0046770 [Aquarana catesbeiana]|uniref:Uncharacterized protein n=1 Tax=Aquarana catesbeiana TaxID=8400 RepID=A0A2G9RJX6_AQUCT|nr:hypothetical protein AB205_0046770 [Aquarana catesbeiana]
MEILEQRSIVGMKLSHVDATVQSLLPSSSSPRQLSVSTKGVCILARPDEEKMHSLEVLCENQCDSTGLQTLAKEEIEEIETTFYRGGKVCWKHLWLAEKNLCENLIEREACKEVETILNNIEKRVRLPVVRIKIVHQPGSGGSTVARQILWKKRKELRCAVVKSSFRVMTVCEHAVNLRQYDEKNMNQCLPILLLIEDCDDEYIDDLRDELIKVMVSRKVVPLKPCFILLSCKRSNAPENLLRFSMQETVIITHTLSEEEKTKFIRKVEKLQKQFSPESIIIFILMSQEFVEEYVSKFVHNVMHNVDHSSNVTRLMRYVALLNCYIQNSYISISHCEAFLGLEPHTSESSSLRQYNFNKCLNEQARLIFIERVDPATSINCIHIIHSRVAEEILKQLPEYPQSQIATDLLQENVLFLHRFGRDEFLGFVKDLLFRRRKISRGDGVDSYMSPLIEHVCNVEKQQEKAIKLLEEAYDRFDKHPLLAQQLARLYYKYDKYEEAKHWAEIAKSQLPKDSFILDTEGQLLSTLEIFPQNKNGESYELVQYLLTDYIPETIKKPWSKYHSHLKGLHKNIYNALDWIAEELNYFQTDKLNEGEDNSEGEDRVYTHRKWLMRKIEAFAKFFSYQLSTSDTDTENAINKLVQKMNIYSLGGGSTTTILSILSDNKDNRSKGKLSDIVDLYKKCIENEILDDGDLINYIMSHIALGCVDLSSPKLLSFPELRQLSKKFQTQRKSFPPSACCCCCSTGLMR